MSAWTKVAWIDWRPSTGASPRRNAAGRSALYTELTRQIADDRELLAILCELEPAKRQPNLLLAAVRHLYGDFARDWPQFRERFFAAGATTRSSSSGRTGRRPTSRLAAPLCSPVLASLPQPLALLEVGTLGRAVPAARSLRL